MGRGIYLGVEGAGNKMSDNGGLIVYKIICWKITTMVLEHTEHPLDTPLKLCFHIILFMVNIVTV